MADEKKIAEFERDVAFDVAAEENVRRAAAERSALEAQIRADDAARESRVMAASASAAHEAVDNANNNTWTTGLIALVIIIGLVIGGSVLYNGYKDKNEKLYTAAVNNVQLQTENRLVRDESARAASRPANVVVIPDTNRNLQRAEEAARPAPATPVPDPAPILVREPAPAPQPSVSAPDTSGSTAIQSTTTTTTTTTNADGSVTTNSSGN